MALTGLASCSNAKYFISAQLDNYDVKGHTIHVEYGDIFKVPTAFVTDISGAEYDISVKNTFVNQQGRDITKRTGMYDLENNNSYTLTYTALSDEVSIKDLVYQVNCSDTLAPIVSLKAISQQYNVGDTFKVEISNISDASGVDESKTSTLLFNKNTGNFVTLTNNSCVLTEKGNYVLKIHVCDILGNEKDENYEFVVLDSYAEPGTNKSIWGFDCIESLSNIHTKSTSDAVEKEITSEKVNGSDASLKLKFKDDYTFEALLTNGHPVNVNDVGSIVLKIYSTNLVDKITFINETNARKVSLDYQVLKNEWFDLEFDPNSIFDENGTINSLTMRIWVEEEADIYIDGIYYTNYVPPWQDEDIAEGLLADFSEEGYLGRLSTVTSADYSTFGGSYYLLKEGSSEIPEGATGGVLKFTSTTDPKNSSVSRDGFHYDYGYKLPTENLNYLIFRLRIDAVEPRYVLELSFDTNIEKTGYTWIDIVPTGDWQNVIVTREALYRALDKDASYITGMNVRIEKYTNQEIVCLFDTIAVISKTREQMLKDGDFDYSFSSVDDLDILATTADSIAKDDEATDGYCAKTTTAYADQGSGMFIYFNDLPINAYKSINLRLKASERVYFAFNEDEVCYYSDVDEKGYVIYNLIDIARTYSNISVISKFSMIRNSFAGIEICVDYIELIHSEPHNYDFSSLDDNDNDIFTATDGWTLHGIVEDASASNGFAYKVTTPANTWNGRAVLYFDEKITISEFTNIYITIKCDTTQICLSADDIYSDNPERTFVIVEGSNSYQTIDLLSNNYISVLSSFDRLYFASGCTEKSVDFYIDKITLVHK